MKTHIKRLKLPHRCLPLFTIPLFVVYCVNTYLSENNTYMYQYNYDVIGYPLITDLGAWMAALVSHIPDRGGQTVRYFGHYCQCIKGKPKKTRRHSTVASHFF